MEKLSFEIEDLFLEYLDSLNDYELFLHYVKGDESNGKIDETLKIRDRLNKEFQKNDGSIFPIFEYFMNSKSENIYLTEDIIILFYKIECYLFLKRGEHKKAYEFFINSIKPHYSKKYDLEKLISVIIFKENVNFDEKIENLQMKILKKIGYEEKIKSGGLDEIINKIRHREKELNIFKLDEIIKNFT